MSMTPGRKDPIARDLRPPPIEVWDSYDPGMVQSLVGSILRVPNGAAVSTATPQTFHVVAHRIDEGARWHLDVLALPGVHAHVRDLGDGADTIRRVIGDTIGRPQQDVDVAITLSSATS